MNNAEITRELMDSLMQMRRTFKHPNHPGPFVGLKPGEIGVLFHIRQACREEPEGIKVSELSCRLHVTSSSVTQQVTNLEEQGLVRRTMDTEDRRAVKVTLTDRGKELTGRAEENLLKMVSGLVEYLGPEKSIQFSGLLKEMFAYFETLN